MKIEITSRYTDNGNEIFVWFLCTGPDGIDNFSGKTDTLGEAFEEIIRKETLNATNYFDGGKNE